MDLKLSGYDVEITNGDLVLVEGVDAVVQDIVMTLRTFLGETPYDRSAGVPWLQIIFRRGTTPQALRFILETIIAGVDGVTDVLELETRLDPETRVANVTGRVRAGDTVVAFDTGDIS